MKRVIRLRQKTNKRLVRPEQHDRWLAFLSVSLRIVDERPGIQFARVFSGDRAACRSGSWTAGSLTRELTHSWLVRALNKAGGKDCLCNPLEKLHRNGLAHCTFSDQLTRQHMVLDNGQTPGARLRQ